jgi:hypothetical protein
VVMTQMWRRRWRCGLAASQADDDGDDAVDVEVLVEVAEARRVLMEWYCYVVQTEPKAEQRKRRPECSEGELGLFANRDLRRI